MKRKLDISRLLNVIGAIAIINILTIGIYYFGKYVTIPLTAPLRGPPPILDFPPITWLFGVIGLLILAGIVLLILLIGYSVIRLFNYLFPNDTNPPQKP